jgi:hypothetical protein
LTQYLDSKLALDYKEFFSPTTELTNLKMLVALKIVHNYLN